MWRDTILPLPLKIKISSYVEIQNCWCIEIQIYCFISLSKVNTPLQSDAKQNAGLDRDKGLIKISYCVTLFTWRYDIHGLS